jgi:cytochrome c-type biogenesis protein CcmH/NrfG
VTKEDGVIDLQQKLQANILDRLNRRKNQRLTRREFEKAIEAMKKQLQTDPDAIQQGVEALLR